MSLAGALALSCPQGPRGGGGGGGGGPPAGADVYWDYDDASGLWSDAGGTTPSPAGGTLRLVSDKSGNGNDGLCTSDTTRDASGLGAVLPGAGGQEFLTPALSLLGCTIVVIAELTGDGYVVAGPSAADLYMYRPGGNVARSGGFGITDNVDPAGFWGSGRHVYTYRIDSARELTVDVDGVTAAVGTLLPDGITAMTGTICLGSSNGASPCAGVIRAFLIYPFALSDIEVSALVAWAATAHP